MLHSILNTTYRLFNLYFFKKEIEVEKKFKVIANGSNQHHYSKPLRVNN